MSSLAAMAISAAGDAMSYFSVAFFSIMNCAKDIYFKNISLRFELNQ